MTLAHSQSKRGDAKGGGGAFTGPRREEYVRELAIARLWELPDSAAMLREIDRIRNRTANMMLTYDKGEKIGDIIWPLDTATGPHGIRQVCRELGIETVGQLKRWYFDDKRRVQLQDALQDRHKLSAVADVVCACDEPLPRSTVAKPTYREVNDKISVIEQRPRPYTPQPKPALARGANPLEKRMATLRTAEDVETADETEAKASVALDGDTQHAGTLAMPYNPPDGYRTPKHWPPLREKMNVALSDVAAGKKIAAIERDRGWGKNIIFAWRAKHPRFAELLKTARQVAAGSSQPSSAAVASPDVVDEPDTDPGIRDTPTQLDVVHTKLADSSGAVPFPYPADKIMSASARAIAEIERAGGRYDDAQGIAQWPFYQEGIDPIWMDAEEWILARQGAAAKILKLEERIANLQAELAERKPEHDMPPLIQGLFEQLPPVGSVWDYGDRLKWLAAVEHCFALLYRDPDDEPLQVKTKGRKRA